METKRDSRRPAHIQTERCPQQPPDSHSQNLMTIVKEDKVLYRKEQLLSPEPDWDFIPPEAEYEAPWNNRHLSEAEIIDNITIEGTSQLKGKIRKLCLAYADIFSSELRSEPANLPPMRLEVDKEKWHTRRHRGPARPQSVENQQETIRQVNKMVEARVIKPSQATEYSQVLLTPKPNGKKKVLYRFPHVQQLLCDAWVAYP